jgi:hypothetical protein
MNISDLQPEVQVKTDKKSTTISVTSTLVNGEQQHPSTGKVTCKTVYSCREKEVVLHFSHDYKGKKEVKIVLPVIAQQSEKAKFVNERELQIQKSSCVVRISANRKLNQLPSAAGRVYNYVPGAEAIPLFVDANSLTVVVSC